MNDEICDERSSFVCDGSSDGIYVEILVGDRDGFDEASNDGIDVERADGLRVKLSVGSCDRSVDNCDGVNDDVNDEICDERFSFVCDGPSDGI